MIPKGLRKKSESSAGGAPGTSPTSLEGVGACNICAASGTALRGTHKSLYAQLLAGLYDAILITDPNGYIIDANPRVEEFFQFKGAEVQDAMVGELISGVDTALLARVRKGLTQGRMIILDAKCVRRDGSTFAGEVSISTIRIMNEGDLFSRCVMWTAARMSGEGCAAGRMPGWRRWHPD